jgi:hypothetical protein
VFLAKGLHREKVRLRQRFRHDGDGRAIFAVYEKDRTYGCARRGRGNGRSIPLHRVSKDGFKIIDFLSPVLDSVLQADLDQALVEAIRSGSGEFEIAIPEILPTGVGSFRFEHAGFSTFHPDLSVELYSVGPGDRLSALRVQALAEIAIETEFGIKSTTTVYREHLYELAGFYDLIREPRVVRIKTSATIGPSDWPVLPRLSLRLAFHDHYAPLERMSARLVKIEQGIAFVKCTSEDELTYLELRLNFAQERLQFDVLDGLVSLDDGSIQAAEAEVTVATFRLDYFKNGILEVWESDAERMLGRCDAFLPHNVDMNSTIANFGATITSLQERAANRRPGQPAKIITDSR